MAWTTHKTENGLVFEVCETKGYTVHVYVLMGKPVWRVKAPGPLGKWMAWGNETTLEKCKVAAFLAILKDRKAKGTVGK